MTHTTQLTRTEKRNQKVAAYQLQQKLQQRRAEEKALRDATLAYREENAVKAYERKNGTAVQRYYKGFGPKKTLPNLPKPRLNAYLLEHGVKAENLGKAYTLFAFTDEDTTTHDLQAAGLLDTQDYFDALNAKAEARYKAGLATAAAKDKAAAYKARFTTKA